MAENLKANDKLSGKTRKEKREAGMGHNLTELRKKAEPMMKKLLKLQDDMDGDAAGYRSQFAKEYEKGAEALGCNKSVLVSEFRRLNRNRKEAMAEQEMDDDERAEREALREALSGTPFGTWAAGDLAPKLVGKGGKEED